MTLMHSYYSVECRACRGQSSDTPVTHTVVAVVVVAVAVLQCVFVFSVHSFLAAALISAQSHLLMVT